MMALDSAVKETLADSVNLPNVPAVAKELLSISEWEGVEIQNVVDIISKDASLTVKILRLVNSPFYAFPREIGTLSQALVVLGLRATRSLTLSFSILSVVPKVKTEDFDYAGFWLRALNTATVARELAVITGFHNEEETFLSGLLQDIGVMALAHCVPERYAPVLRETPDKLAPSLATEQKHLATDHVEVAKLLFDKWNFPPSLCTPVLYHHAPEEAEDADLQTRLAIRIQHLAGLLGEWLYAGKPNAESLDKLRELAARYFEMSAEKLENVMRRTDEQMSENAALFGFAAPQPNSYAGLLQKANLILGETSGNQEVLMQELVVAREEAQKLSADLRSANNKLLDEARSDSLTGLGNRRMFEQFIHGEIDRSVRYQHAFALLFIDIDNFKSINDKYGHLAGDAVLKHVAGLFKHAVRVSDVVARYGGEEFVVMLVETEEKSAKETAERIRRTIEIKPCKATSKHPPIQFTVSIGLVLWSPGEKPVTPRALVTKADEAMYEAKKAGKNCVRIK